MIFVLEIKGTAVLAFEADNTDDANAYAKDKEVREDLQELTCDGEPLWNGTDEISVRSADDEETELFEETRAEDWEEDEHADSEDFAVYLVPLDDPDDDEEEE